MLKFYNMKMHNLLYNLKLHTYMQKLQMNGKT